MKVIPQDPPCGGGSSSENSEPRLGISGASVRRAFGLLPPRAVSCPSRDAPRAKVRGRPWGAPHLTVVPSRPGVLPRAPCAYPPRSVREPAALCAQTRRAPCAIRPAQRWAGNQILPIEMSPVYLAVKAGCVEFVNLEMFTTESPPEGRIPKTSKSLLYLYGTNKPASKKCMRTKVRIIHSANSRWKKPRKGKPRTHNTRVRAPFHTSELSASPMRLPTTSPAPPSPSPPLQL